MRVPGIIGRNLLALALAMMTIGWMAGCGGGSAPATGTTVETNTEEQANTQKTMEDYYNQQKKK